MREVECWQTLLTGDVKRAVGGFQALVRAEDSTNAHAGLFLAACAAGANDAALKILQDRQARARDGGLLLWRAVWIAARNGLSPFVERVDAILARSDRPAGYRAPCAYGRGHIAAVAGDVDGAVGHFTQAGALFEQGFDFFMEKADAALKSTAFQAMHMIGEEGFATLAARDEVVEPAPGFLGAPLPVETAAGRRQILVAADPHYLKRFGPDFVRSLAAIEGPCALHVHIVDGGEADFEAIAGARPAGAEIHMTASLARSDHWPVRKPPVYASARFLAGPHIVEWLDRPTLVLDIDLQLTRPLGPFFEAAWAHDFCCIVRPDGGPGGYCFAAATAFAPGPGQAMAALAGRYIAARFALEQERLWFVDQAALFRAAAHLHAAEGARFRWGDFGARAGALADFFVHAEETPDKRR